MRGSNHDTSKKLGETVGLQSHRSSASSSSRSVAPHGEVPSMCPDFPSAPPQNHGCDAAITRFPHPPTFACGTAATPALICEPAAVLASSARSRQPGPASTRRIPRSHINSPVVMGEINKQTHPVTTPAHRRRLPRCSRPDPRHLSLPPMRRTSTRQKHRRDFVFWREMGTRKGKRNGA